MHSSAPEGAGVLGLLVAVLAARPEGAHFRYGALLVPVRLTGIVNVAP